MLTLGLLLLANTVLSLEAGVRTLEQAEHAQSDEYQDKSQDKSKEAHRGKPSPQDQVAPRLGETDSPLSDDISARQAPKLLADIRVHTPEQLDQVLSRVDKLFSDGGIASNDPPVVFLLHGDEARVLYQQNYSTYKKVVDLAARLSAFDVVDIRVCEVWSDGKGLDNNNLQPFVDTVRFAPAEKRRLRKSGYEYF